MKAKNTCGRLARILAVLMAMTLIISCTAVALAEEAESTPATDKEFVISIAEESPETTHFTEAISSKLEEVGFTKTTYLKSYKAFMRQPAAPEACKVAIFLDSTGEDFINFEKDIPTDVLFFVDAFNLQFDTDPNEMDCVYWAYVLFDHAVNGEQVYIYATSSFSNSANFTRYFIASFLNNDLSDLGFTVTPVEEEEGTYLVTSLSSGATGYIHTKQLDMPVEEAFPIVLEEFCEVLAGV